MFDIKHKIKFVKQTDSNDCGLACLSMLSTYFGNRILINDLKFITNINSEGVSIDNLIDTAFKIDLELIPLYLSKDQLHTDIPLPVVVFWGQNHFLLIEKITDKYIYIVDPAIGKIKITNQEFYDGWLTNNSIGNVDQNLKKGILLLVKPLPEFGNNQVKSNDKSNNRKFIKENFLSYKEDNLRIFLSLLVVSILQLVLPFSNQLIVDIGVQQNNLPFIYIVGIFISIFYLLISINEFIRSWSLVYLGTRINFKLISKFLMKITSLPIKTIYSKKIGDYIERINDHKRLEEFFSESIINSLFSIVTLIIYSLLLSYFSFKIFVVVLILSILELIWIFRFLDSIKTIDNKLFSLNAQDQEKIYEILSNLPDIKLNNLEADKNKEWKQIQGKLFKINLTKIKLSQIEKGGSKILSSIQLVIVTILCATLATKGEISLGTMLSILFLVSQLNYPISHLINFILQTQVIGNSFQRISEIHNLQEEDNEGLEIESLIDNDIYIEKLNFSYQPRLKILNEISFKIPKNKTTAIVGYSGSGKTTLLKILLKFYDNYDGQIHVGNSELNLKQIKSSFWRNNCGAVLQESSIYSESIAYNIALKAIDEIDEKRLYNAIHLSCLSEFVEDLPLGVFTKLNSNGASISSGQKQRLLIARLIYKNPTFIFLDEATNSLDSNTEKSILNNLTNFFKDKTVLVVAHRLSTVKNADQIIVLEKGSINEIGTHTELINNQSSYYNLIKNQLELEK